MKVEKTVEIGTTLDLLSETAEVRANDFVDHLGATNHLIKLIGVLAAVGGPDLQVPPSAPGGGRPLQSFAHREGYGQLLVQARLIQEFAGNCLITKASPYQRRRGIIPAAPAMLRLLDQIATTRSLLEDAPFKPSGPPPRGSMVVSTKTGQEIVIPCQIPDSPGMDEYSFLRAELQLSENRIAQITQEYGGPAVLVKQPKLKTCEMLLRSLEAADLDAEDFLRWFVERCLEKGKAADPIVAHILWSRSRERIGRATKSTTVPWQEWDEEGLYKRLGNAAKRRMLRPDPVWAVGEWHPIPMSEIPELSDPFRTMFGLAASLDDVPMDDPPQEKLDELRLYTGLRLTLDEARYVFYKKIHGLTQAEAADRMGLNRLQFQRLRRSADKKIATRGRRTRWQYTLPRPRGWYAGTLASNGLFISRSNVMEMES